MTIKGNTRTGGYACFVEDRCIGDTRKWIVRLAANTSEHVRADHRCKVIWLKERRK